MRTYTLGLKSIFCMGWWYCNVIRGLFSITSDFSLFIYEKTRFKCTQASNLCHSNSFSFSQPAHTGIILEFYYTLQKERNIEMNGLALKIQIQMTM
jgi:hypothetical protein